MKPLRIYLGDLTHDSVGLATEVFPLNIGFVAAYCKNRFKEKVDVQLFKYIPDLENAIYKDPPDVLALSNYPWCHNISMAMLELLSEIRPESIRILGGPNFPHLPELQVQFLSNRPLIDAYPYIDGEAGFANIIEAILSVSDIKDARRLLKSKPITGCVQLGENKQLIAPAVSIRLTSLDEIPSPYTMGLLDKFFDGRLSPMIQTNRGCPFTCTFCADGTKLVSKINHFSFERVKQDLLYIAERVPQNVKTLHISDLNYGMYARDEEVSAAIAEIKIKYNYPNYIDTNTGKNSKERVITNIEKLSGALPMGMSVQSLTPEVLKNIKRENLRLDDILGLRTALKKAGLYTAAEVILALPGETKKTHIDSINNLVMSGIDNVFAYTLMLLNGTELNTPDQRTKWGYETKFRVIPRDFTKLSSGKKVVEVEEVVISTNTLPFEDYIECRKYVLLSNASTNLGFRPLFRFIIQNKIQIKDIVYRMLNAINEATLEQNSAAAPSKLVHLVREFTRETKEELWDTEEELVAFFQNDEAFTGLLNGRYGANLLQTYRARVWAHAFDGLADCLFFHTASLIHEENMGAELLEHLHEIELFCRATTYNILGKDRFQTIPEISIIYDVEGWSNDIEDRPITEFKWDNPRLVRFTITEAQFKHVEDQLDHFGHNDLGRGKLLIRISPNSFWRSPIYGDDFDRKFPRIPNKLPQFLTIETNNRYYQIRV